MQAVRPAAARHEASGEFVDDDDLAVLDDVLDVGAVQRMRAHCLRDGVQHVDIRRVVQLDAAEELLCVQDAILCHRCGVLLLVDLVVLVGDQLRDDARRDVVLVGRLFRGAADDERGSGFVDQDRVDLVDDRVDRIALDHRLKVELHVVAEVVEPELVVRSVRDVAGVRFLPLAVAVLVLDDADREPEEAVDTAHPLGVATGEVVIDGDDVDPAAGERVEVDSESRDERLAFAGLHLGDLAAVQDDAAHQLNVEVPHVQHALAGLAADGKRFWQELVELGLQVGLRRLDDVLVARNGRLRFLDGLHCGAETGAELVGLRPQLIIGQCCY